MSGDTVFALLFLISLGLGLIYGGLLFHLGRWRRWYLAPDTIFGGRNAMYGLIPMGASFICVAISVKLPTLEMRQFGMGYISLPLGGLALLMMFLQPKLLRPKWVYWLEKNNADILDLIIEEGRKTEDWGKVVATKEGLETWVNQVREKHREEYKATLIRIKQAIETKKSSGVDYKAMANEINHHHLITPDVLASIVKYNNYFPSSEQLKILCNWLGINQSS